MSDQAPVAPMDFSTFVVSLGSSVMMSLKGEHSAAIDLTMAQQSIDILTMLEEKTRGNLSEEELKLLSGVIYQARVAYMEAESHTRA